MVIVSVVGAGIMGIYMATSLAPAVDKVCLLTNRPDEVTPRFRGDKFYVTSDTRQAVRDAGLVIFCSKTEEVYKKMLEVLPYCKQDAIISGQTSRKEPEARAFYDYTRQAPSHRLIYIPIHSPFHPEKVKNPKNWPLAVIREGADDKEYSFAKSLFQAITKRIAEFETVDDHDKYMAELQVDATWRNRAIASAFAHARCSPYSDPRYNNALDRMKFAMAMRMLDTPSHVYKGILIGNPHAAKLVESSLQTEQELFEMVQGGHKKDYRKRVMAAREILNQKTYLTDGMIKHFGNLDGKMPNSHIAEISWVVAAHSYGLNLTDMVQFYTTPTQAALFAISNWLFAEQGRLESAINAPFHDEILRQHDIIFHTQFNEWGRAITNNDSALFDKLEKAMRARIPKGTIGRENELSKIVAAFVEDAIFSDKK